MKLLFDQNLSPRLTSLLGDLYPGSSHVQVLTLDTVSDDALWAYARDHNFVIVTRDEDFNALAVIRGFPPKVIWLQLGNCTTAQVEAALRNSHAALKSFDTDPSVSTFVLQPLRITPNRTRPMP